MAAADRSYRSLERRHQIVLVQMTKHWKKRDRNVRKEIQRKLKSNGYFNGLITGIFGSATISALKRLAG